MWLHDIIDYVIFCYIASFDCIGPNAMASRHYGGALRRLGPLALSSQQHPPCRPFWRLRLRIEPRRKPPDGISGSSRSP